ncbi:MAG: acetylxylan esterase [Nocardioides sp.]|nr:acetylxylan esterase [Nocardioides sp.]
MPRLDLPLSELWTLREDIPEPPGFEEFWRRTLEEQARMPLEVEAHPVDSPLTSITTYDVTYGGFAGDPIKAWLHLPAGAERGRPGVVQFQGYNGGRGLPHEHTFWASVGFPHLVMDTRGQGSGWSTGETADPHPAGPAQGGFLTRGIERPEDFYYRRVYVDALRAVEVMRGRPEVNPSRVIVTGRSQGGGIALATVALSANVAAAMVDVPFLCHFRRAAEISPGDPYAEIARYLAAHRDRTAQAFATLTHFDGAVLARRAAAPALFSVALMDTICLPSTVFAAYHSYAGPKEIEVYEFNDHEGGGAQHQLRQVAWLNALLER